MSKNNVDEILQRLNGTEVDPLDLLSVYENPEFEKWWRQDPRLHRGFAKKLIGSGHPNSAIGLIRAGLRVHENDLDLTYLIALAYARGGNISQAQRQVCKLLKTPDLPVYLEVEARSLQGRLCKDRYRRTEDPAEKRRCAKEAADEYLKAYELTQDLFPAINAATMFLLAGKRMKTRDLATAIVKEGTRQLRLADKEKDYWHWATLGEAHFLLGQLTQAANCYRKAIALAGKRVGDIAAMRTNYRLIRDKIKVEDEIWRLFNVGSVVVFAGHMLDHPARRGQPRFPHDPELERRVSRAIKEKIEALNATVGYCCAACGSDILFAERMLERDPMELHVVVPFHKADFCYTSVDFGYSELTPWRMRSEAVLARARQVHYATTEHYLGDDVLFAFANTFIQGLAMTRAAERGVDGHALIVLDESSPELIGGTRYFLEHWRRTGQPCDTISLPALRDGIGVHLPRNWDKPAAPTELGKGAGLKRQVKAMIFADVKDSSKLPEELSPTFHYRFLDEVVQAIQASSRKPDFCNTWGGRALRRVRHCGRRRRVRAALAGTVGEGGLGEARD